MTDHITATRALIAELLEYREQQTVAGGSWWEAPEICTQAADAIARLTAERDQALARLAVAQRETAEQCASTVYNYGQGAPYNQRASITALAISLRALPIDLDAEAALQRVVDATVPETLTDAQVNDACMSYRHDFGLLEGNELELAKFQCREWWRSIRRALMRPEASHE